MRPSLLVLASGVSAVQLRVESTSRVERSNSPDIFQGTEKNTWPHCSDSSDATCLKVPEEGKPEDLAEPKGIAPEDYVGLLGFIAPPPKQGAASARTTGQSIIAATVLGCNRKISLPYKESGKHPLFGQYVDGACSSEAAYKFGVEVAFSREYMKTAICTKSTFGGKPFSLFFEAAECTIDVAPVCSSDKSIIYLNECHFYADPANVGKTANDMIHVVNPNAEQKWAVNRPAQDPDLVAYCEQ